MDKHGQVFFFTLMVGLVVIIIALSLAFPVKENVDIVRNATNMDCGNSSISNFDKAACTVADLSIFYFIGGLIFIGGAILTAKVLFGK